MLKAPYVTNYLSEHFADDDYGSLAGYERRGGYEAARKALRMAPDDFLGGKLESRGGRNTRGVVESGQLGHRRTELRVLVNVARQRIERLGLPYLDDEASVGLLRDLGPRIRGAAGDTEAEADP